MLFDHLDKLQYFSGVVKAGSIRRYAQENNKAQPGVSRNIQILETELETALFFRGKGGVELTDSGRKLFEFSESVLKMASLVESAIHRTGKMKLSGSVRLGAYSSLSVYFLPGFVNYVKRSQSEVNINIVTAQSINLIEQLRNGKVDIVISVDPKKNREIRSRTLFTDHYSLYKNRISEERDTHVFLVPQAKDRLGESLQSFFEKLAPNQNWSSCDDFETVKAMVESGVGQGILPERVAGPLVSSGKIEVASSARGLSHFGEHSICLSYRKAREADSLIIWISAKLEEMLMKTYYSSPSRITPW